MQQFMRIDAAVGQQQHRQRQQKMVKTMAQGKKAKNHYYQTTDRSLDEACVRFNAQRWPMRWLANLDNNWLGQGLPFSFHKTGPQNNRACNPLPARRCKQGFATLI